MDMHRLFDQEEILKKIVAKEIVVAERNKGKIPYSSQNGLFDDQTKNISFWTNGFWGGILWEMYALTKESVFKEEAERLEDKLDAVLINAGGLDHDNGFKWLPTAVADYEMLGNHKSLNRGLLAAENLAGRFNPEGNYIRAWDFLYDGHNSSGIVIIDCMMNLPILFWASKVTDDARFLNIADLHATTVVNNFIREDGSVRHIVEFDPYTGKFVRDYGGQGCAHGSAWTRGQAWGIYGFILAYKHTKKLIYLRAAEKIANHFIAVMQSDGLIPIDFDQPEDPAWRDSSAGAIAACGLLEIYEANKDDKYKNAALQLIQNILLLDCDLSPDTDPILNCCSKQYHDDSHEYSIIYGDYFFIEAILRLNDVYFPIW